MRTSLKTTLILAVAATAGIMLSNVAEKATLSQEVGPEVHEAFQKWTMTNTRLYGTPSEQNYRLNVFAQNYKAVEDLKNKVSHQVGLTIFADLTEEEFLTKHTGLLLQKPNGKINQPSLVSKFVDSMPLGELPDRIDHRVEGGLSTPVKNQRSCGSCWAFAAIASFEGAWIKGKHTSTLFSEQQLVDCSVGYGNSGCAGGWMTFGYNYLKEQGAMKGSDYPYMSIDQSCKQKEPEYVAQILRYVELPAKDPVALKKAVSENIVSVAVDARSWMSYTGGIIKSNCENKLNHGVVIVGYGIEDSTNDKYWIIKNSWGPSWGEKGYIRVLDTGVFEDGVCGINMVNSYVDLVMEAH